MLLVVYWITHEMNLLEGDRNATKSLLKCYLSCKIVKLSTYLIDIIWY